MNTLEKTMSKTFGSALATNFDANPAMQFMTHPKYEEIIPDAEKLEEKIPATEKLDLEENDPPITTDKPSAASKGNTKQQHELKSKRVNFVLAPSLHAEIVKIAYVKHLSINATFNKALEYYRNHCRKELAQYDAIEKLKDKSE
jgi:hypothetical protein